MSSIQKKKNTNLLKISLVSHLFSFFGNSFQDFTVVCVFFTRLLRITLGRFFKNAAFGDVTTMIERLRFLLTNILLKKPI